MRERQKSLDIGFAAAVDELTRKVAGALAISDSLCLWDVSIGLDRTRLVLEELRSLSGMPPSDQPVPELSLLLDPPKQAMAAV